MPSVRRLKMMVTPQEFYTWNWIIRERQKAEAGDKTAFQPSDEELAAQWIAKKGKTADG